MVRSPFPRNSCTPPATAAAVPAAERPVFNLRTVRSNCWTDLKPLTDGADLPKTRAAAPATTPAPLATAPRKAGCVSTITGAGPKPRFPMEEKAGADRAGVKVGLTTGPSIGCLELPRVATEMGGMFPTAVAAAPIALCCARRSFLPSSL